MSQDQSCPDEQKCGNSKFGCNLTSRVKPDIHNTKSIYFSSYHVSVIIIHDLRNTQCWQTSSWQ